MKPIPCLITTAARPEGLARFFVRVDYRDPSVVTTANAKDATHFPSQRKANAQARELRTRFPLRIAVKGAQ